MDIQEFNNKINNMTGDLEKKIVFGWNSTEDAANDIYSGFHRCLLDGEPLFLYRNNKGTGNLLQVVVVRNLDYQNGNRYTGDYGVGLIYTGHTELYPHIPADFVTEDVVKYLEDKEAKVEKEIIAVYKQLIGRIERRKENE